MRERIAARDAAFARSYLIQVLAMPAAIFVAMILMVGFTGGIVKRVDKMRGERQAARQGTAARRPGHLER